MKLLVQKNGQCRALTLMEILMVVVVGFILAALLIPVAPARRTPKIARAKIDMSALVNAINSYEADYNHLPLADYSTNEDTTLGIGPGELQNLHKPRGTTLVESNSDLIVVLMDFNYSVNTNHQLNPKWIKYLNAKMSGDTTSPGVGTDFQYRDPWGNPYVISLDANQDGLVCDAIYSNPALYPDNTPTSLLKTNGLFEKQGKVMVWSRGPDGKASITIPAKSGANKDNLLSWE